MKRLFALIALAFLNVESTIININQINGPNNLVYYGLDNKINGRDNKVAGFDNDISGQRNIAKGDQNILRGDGNLVDGYGNNIGGQGNLVSGQGNVVLGPDSSKEDIDKMNQRMLDIFASRGFGGIVGLNIAPNQNYYLDQYQVQSQNQYKSQPQPQPQLQSPIQIQTQNKTQQNSKLQNSKTSTWVQNWVQNLQQQDQQPAKNQQLIIAIDQGSVEEINVKKEQIKSEIFLQAQDKNYNVQQQAKQAVQNCIPCVQQKKQAQSKKQQIQKTDLNQDNDFKFVIHDNTDAISQQATPSVNSLLSNESNQTRQIRVFQQSQEIYESKNNQNNKKFQNNNQSEVSISQQIKAISQPLKAINIPPQFSAYGQESVIIL